MEGADLEEFSHLVVYDDIPEGSQTNYPPDSHELALRERELAIRQRELALREQEMRMRRGPPGPRRGPTPSIRNVPHGGGGGFDDDDEDDDYFDPTGPPPGPRIDPDNFDMMSVTSKKNRRIPSASNSRKPEFEQINPPSRGSRFRPHFGSRNRSSQQLMSQSINLTDNILDDPLMSCSSNRYGAVDRGMMQAESRANSLTASRLDDLQYQGGPGGPPMGMNGGYPRRASQSPGNPYSPSMRGGNGGRPSPPNGYGGPQQPNGRPSPPNGMMQQPVPRYPPGHGNAVAPQQVEQHVGRGQW